MPTNPVGERASTSLRVHALQLDIIASYGALLEQDIFNHPDVDREIGKKLAQSQRRTLKSIDAYKILSIIWKESEFISSGDLRAAGLTSLFERKQLTAYGLACEIAETKYEVAAVNTRIRNIAVAASTYQLMDRSAAGSTAKMLKGTRLLHDFMTKLSERDIQAWTNFTEISHPSAHRFPSGDR
jgi:hypothetical protein